MANAEISPQMAHSIEASAKRWRQVMKDYRFLTREEIRGKRAERIASQILQIKHNGVVLYPEFQFNAAGQLRALIPDLMDIAKKNGWSRESLILWLVTPTGFFDDQAPIKYLDDPNMILAGARSRFEQSW